MLVITSSDLCENFKTGLLCGYANNNTLNACIDEIITQLNNNYSEVDITNLTLIKKECENIIDVPIMINYYFQLSFSYKEKK